MSDSKPSRLGGVVGSVAAIPVLAVAAVLGVRALAFSSTDAWIRSNRAARAAWSGADAGAARCDLGAGVIVTVMAGVLLAGLAWGGRGVRTGRRRVAWPEWVASVVFGLLSAYAAMNTGFWQLASEGASGGSGSSASLVVAGGVGWIASWAGTFAMAGCLLPDALERPADALARLRTLLYANAALVASASATSVLAYRAAYARLREGADAGLDAAGLASLERATALFYVLILAAKFLPAWGILRARVPKPAGPEGSGDDGGWTTFLTLTKDVVAVLSPALAALLTRWTTG